MRDEVKVVLQPAGEGLFRPVGIEDREGNVTYLGRQDEVSGHEDGSDRWLRSIALEPVVGSAEPLYRLVLSFEEVEIEPPAEQRDHGQ